MICDYGCGQEAKYQFGNLFNDLRSTTKPSEKQKVLLCYDSPDLRELLRLTYDPFILFNVSIKPKEIPSPGEYDLGDIFNQAEAVFRFCEKSASAKQNRSMVISLLEKLNSGSQELLVGVINKNWAVGVSSKAVLKWVPGLIKQFNVQLANTYDPSKSGHRLLRWHLSYKLDGLRCVALRIKDEWLLYSRKGNEFYTVNHLKGQLESLYKAFGWTFFDGELYKHGLEFEKIQGPVMAFTQGQVPEMEYHCFIAGKAENFLLGQNSNCVNVLLEGSVPEEITHIKFVGQGIIPASSVEEKLEEAFEHGYEGIMLRDPDHLYDYKRSNALLKIKHRLNESEEAFGEIVSDCVVISIDYNENFPVIEDGVLRTENLLAIIWVQQEDGTQCKVGSGFSLVFRRKYTENPQDLIGKIVEVRHQGYGTNGRMRFPRLLRVRDDL